MPIMSRRLTRNRSELAERVEQGELSANAAALEAGFRVYSTIGHLEIVA